MGLLNIESRSKAINGKYTIWTQPLEGFKFLMDVPLELFSDGRHEESLNI